MTLSDDMKKGYIVGYWYCLAQITLPKDDLKLVGKTISVAIKDTCAEMKVPITTQEVSDLLDFDTLMETNVDELRKKLP